MDENKYDKSISRWYDRIMEAGYYDHDSIANALVKVLGRRKKILEIGIGTGLLAQRLLAMGCEVSGIDFTESMLDIARKRLGSRVKLYCQNVVMLDLPETYEAAVSEGGVWIAARELDGRVFLESHITDLEQNVIGMKKVAEHLSGRCLLVLGIQPAHKDFGGLQLRGGAVYSQKVMHRGNLIDKEYFVKKGGRTVAHQRCTYRRFTGPERRNIIKAAGFVEIGFDRGKQLLVFEKSG